MQKNNASSSIKTLRTLANSTLAWKTDFGFRNARNSASECSISGEAERSMPLAPPGSSCFRSSQLVLQYILPWVTETEATEVEIFLLFPGLLIHRKVTSQHQLCRYSFIHRSGERHCESEVSCPRTQHNVPKWT